MPGEAFSEPAVSETQIKEAVKELADTVVFDKQANALTFTVLNDAPEGYSWFIHTAGEEAIGEAKERMSFVAFENERDSASWETGKTYTYSFGQDELIEAYVSVGVIDQRAAGIQCVRSLKIDGEGNITVEE